MYGISSVILPEYLHKIWFTINKWIANNWRTKTLFLDLELRSQEKSKTVFKQRRTGLKKTAKLELSPQRIVGQLYVLSWQVHSTKNAAFALTDSKRCWTIKCSADVIKLSAGGFILFSMVETPQLPKQHLLGKKTPGGGYAIQSLPLIMLSKCFPIFSTWKHIWCSVKNVSPLINSKSLWTIYFKRNSSL